VNNCHREELKSYMLEFFNFEIIAFKIQAKDTWRDLDLLEPRRRYESAVVTSCRGLVHHLRCGFPTTGNVTQISMPE
jgi:hypothetical protein